MVCLLLQQCQCFIGHCCLQQGQREDRGGTKNERQRKEVEPWSVTVPQRVSFTWPKRPAGYIERQSVKSKQALGFLTVLQGAPVSSILHAGACLKPLLLVSAWEAWLCCPGPSGLPVSPTHKHEQLPWLFHYLSVTSSSFQNNSLKTSLCTFTKYHELQKSVIHSLLILMNINYLQKPNLHTKSTNIYQ